MWAFAQRVLVAVLIVALTILVSVGVIGMTGHFVKWCANAWTSNGSAAPVCEKIDGPCTAREQYLVLHTQVQDGKEVTQAKMNEVAVSQAGMFIATEKARLAEENFNRRANEAVAKAQQLDRQQQRESGSAGSSPSGDPCANQQGNARTICEGLR